MLIRRNPICNIIIPGFKLHCQRVCGNLNTLGFFYGLIVQATSSTSSPPTATSASTSAATSDCQSLKSLYSPFIPAGGVIQFSVQFDIQRQSDYDLASFMRIHAKTFEDCIFACASYTMVLKSQSDGACTIASYEDSGDVSCWLKRSINDTMIAY